MRSLCISAFPIATDPLHNGQSTAFPHSCSPRAVGRRSLCIEAPPIGIGPMHSGPDATDLVSLCIVASPIATGTMHNGQNTGSGTDSLVFPCSERAAEEGS